MKTKYLVILCAVLACILLIADLAYIAVKFLSLFCILLGVLWLILDPPWKRDKT